MLAPKALTMGCNVKTGTKGVDFFHGENALLDFVYAALDFFLCLYLKLHVL
ncbi:hypothetical protein L916_08383 [Phytophthora nicotianae]|uniref:Uncharacterized protein n=1 Tax=Phytophthora nicotianae TaxID=4792 RepID=W2J1W6_PHYNI|nr:hypothetical protein L916_08383 [Phytophthora nicotianae]